jgi:hypothetical protein
VQRLGAWVLDVFMRRQISAANSGEYEEGRPTFLATGRLASVFHFEIETNIRSRPSSVNVPAGLLTMVSLARRKVRVPINGAGAARVGVYAPFY